MTKAKHWETVYNAMHWNGKSRVSREDFEKIYVNCADGFGKIDYKFATEQCWDWSHVRDSSPEALERMAKEIEALRKQSN